ncbi:LOW QUALITY PROTEIN: hypothetical protein T265_12814, partial [Opisthorchis viverrini]
EDTVLISRSKKIWCQPSRRRGSDRQIINEYKLNPGMAIGYALLMSINKSETRVQCFLWCGPTGIIAPEQEDGRSNESGVTTNKIHIPRKPQNCNYRFIGRVPLSNKLQPPRSSALFVHKYEPVTKSGNKHNALVCQEIIVYVHRTQRVCKAWLTCFLGYFFPETKVPLEALSVLVLVRRSFVIATVVNQRVLQFRWITHDTGCVRTNQVAWELANSYQFSGMHIFEELRAPTSASFIKPHLCAFQGPLAAVTNFSLNAFAFFGIKEAEKRYLLFFPLITSALHIILREADFLVHQKMIIFIEAAALLSLSRLLLKCVFQRSRAVCELAVFALYDSFICSRFN